MKEYFYWSGIIFNLIVVLFIAFRLLSYIPDTTKRIRIFSLNVLGVLIFRPFWAGKIEERIANLKKGLDNGWVKKENVWVYKWWIYILNKRLTN